MVTLSLDVDGSKRSLTKFICQELLYDAISGKLDSARKAEVDSFILTCKDSQRELEKLSKGLKFVEQIRKVEVSKDLRSGLINYQPRWKVLMSQGSLWSSRRGWKVLPYIFLSAIIILGLGIFKPWQIRVNPEVTLIEQVKMEPDIVSSPADVVVAPAEVNLTVDAATSQNLVSPVADSNETKPPVKVATTTGVAGPAEPTPAATAAPHQIAKEVVGTQKGALTRGVLEVSDFASAWPAIRDKILALDGKVAGNVELGWLRRKNEAYFHFSLPESNKPELEIFLKTFGPVRFSTEPHSRVMPEGQIRLILTVKDGNTNEGSSETP